MPHDLTLGQKKKRVDRSDKLYFLHRILKWLDYLVTRDEDWCLYVTVERRRQWLKPGQGPKNWFAPQKKDGHSLVVCKGRNMLGAFSGKHHSKRH